MTPEPAPTWTLLSNHGRVLACLARDPSQRLRDLAAIVDLTERAVQKILGDLESGGLLSRRRVGRRNHYRLHLERRVAMPAGEAAALGGVLASLAAPAP